MPHWFWLTCLFMVVCGGDVFLRTASGQEQSPSAESSAQKTDSQDVKKTAESPQTIYLPFSDLTATFEKPDTKVVIPYGEYRRLLESIRSGQTPPLAPAAVVTQAEYDIQVDGELARIRAQLKVQVLREGWTEVPIHFGKATIGRLKSADKVLLRGTGDGQNLLLFPGQGEFDVELQLAATVRQSPASREILFECPPVALTTVRVTVPDQGQQINFTPAGVKLPVPAAEGDHSRAAAQVGAVSQIAIHWKPAESQTPAMNLLASVNNRTLVTIADGLIHTDATLGYDILRGELSETRIVLPRSARLLDVFADQGTSQWTSAVDGNNQIVTLKLSAPVQGKLRVTVRAESPLRDSEFMVAGVSSEKVAAGVHALDAVRESGQIALRHSADLSVNVLDQQGLVRIENGEADPQLAGPNALLFKFYSPQISLKLSAQPVAPRLQVEHRVALMFQNDELRFHDRLAYQVERAGVFELILQLPEGVVVDRVDSPAMKEFNIDAASRKLTVLLRERTQGKIDLEIQGHLSLNEADDELKLPILEPLQVDREQGTVEIFSRDSLEVQAVQAGVESAQPLPISGRTAHGELRLSSAWTFTRRPVVIPVRVIHKPTRLRAEQGTLIQVNPEQASVTSTLSFLIEYAPVDEFRIDVPESISSRLQIEVPAGDAESASIKQKEAGPAENGRVVWTIQTSRKVPRKQTFLLTYDLLPVQAAAEDAPSEQSDAGAQADAGAQTAAEVSGKNYEFALIRPLGSRTSEGSGVVPLAEFRGEIAVKKEQTLAIRASSTGNGVEQIDVRELRLLPESATLAFRYFRDDPDNPVGLKVTASHFDLQDVVATAISRGLVEIVASEDQSVTYRCRYRVKSTERQRLLIFLPKDLEVLGAFLNDREVKLEKANVRVPTHLNPSLAPFWINVARSESSETPFLLTLQFLWNLKSGTNAHLLEESLLALPLPALGAEKQGVVQELKVVVWMPEEYALIGDPDPFLLQKKQRPCAFLLGTPADHETSGLAAWVTEGGSESSGFAELPTEGRRAFIFSTLGEASEITARVWNKGWMTLLISGTLVLIGWILLGTSWENKLGILLLAGFAAVMYGLFDSHGLAQGVHAARYGLVVLLAMWVLHGLCNLCRPRPIPRSRDGAPGDYVSTDIPYAVIPPPGVFERLQPGS